MNVEIRNVKIRPGGPIGHVVVAAGVVRSISAETSSDDVKAVDGKRRTLMPGLRDMHTHLPSVATASRRIDVTAAKSAAEAAEIIVARHDPKAPVVVARGMFPALWPSPPHKDILEAALPGVAVFVGGNDGHTAWLSPAALQKIDKADHHNGVLVEQECFEAGELLRPTDADYVRRSVSGVTTAAAARGLTQVQDFDPAPLSEWVRGVHEHGLDLRVICGVRGQYIEEAVELGLTTGFKPDDVHGLLTVGPIKLFSDGALNSRTALMHAPYAGGEGDDCGLMELTPDDLEQQIRRATDAGLGVAVHAIGDRANTLVLDAFERVGVTGRIEHAQVVRPADIPRFAQLGVVASIQPAHQPDDRDVADVYWPHIGDQVYPYASLLVAGATLELGSDAPVAPLDPWDGIASAVTRTDDDRPAWHPAQALTVEQAITATCGGRMSIDVGDVADLVLVDEDPLEVAPKDLRDMPVAATMLGGRWTHRTPDLQ